VELNGPAPSGGALISLSSSDTAVASVPNTVTLSSGSTTATFVVNTSAVPQSTAVTFSASYQSATPTANLTVSP